MAHWPPGPSLLGEGGRQAGRGARPQDVPDQQRKHHLAPISRAVQAHAHAPIGRQITLSLCPNRRIICSQPLAITEHVFYYCDGASCSCSAATTAVSMRSV